MIKTYNKWGVFGAGSWGSALATKLALNNLAVTIFCNDSTTAQEINNNHTNEGYLPNIKLDKAIIATDDIDKFINQEVIIIAIPSSAFKETVQLFKKHNIPSSTILLIATKGLIDHPVCLFSEYLNRELTNNCAFIYGPNFAKEVAQDLYSSATIGCGDLTIAKNLAQDIQTENFIIDSTNDIITLQIAATIKNIVAILSGINDAEGVRENAKAALIVQALKEIKVLSNAMGGVDETLLTYGVIGDLVLTCYSKTSRNMRFGCEFILAPNKKEFLKNLPYLVEGYKSINSLVSLASQYNISLPLIESINKILEEDK